MEREYEVTWTEPAIADVEAISAYIAETSPDAAGRTRDAILKSVEILGMLPFIGPIYSQGRRGPIRQITYKKYRIFYRVIDESGRVDILTVWHGSRREPDFS